MSSMMAEAVGGIKSVPSVCVCPPVRLCVRLLGVDLDNILDECKGHGHRSKVKVTNLKKVIFFSFRFVDLCTILSVMT